MRFFVTKRNKKIFCHSQYKKRTDNKTFWQTIKPFLSGKTKSREKITLIEKEKLVAKVANYLNIFFSNVAKNLEIPKYLVKESFHENIKCSTLKAVLKYRKHPSIISISHSFHQASSFNFSCIDKNAVLKEILRLRATKASEDTDILKIFKRKWALIYPYNFKKKMLITLQNLFVFSLMNQ